MHSKEHRTEQKARRATAKHYRHSSWTPNTMMRMMFNTVVAVVECRVHQTEEDRKRRKQKS